MAKKKKSLIGMKREELEKQIAGLREEVRVTHFKAEGARSKNVKELKELRKQIARILTVLNQA